MKSTIKTAISVDKETFEKVEKISKKLHISRSRFFAQAAQYMITHNENIDLLRRINAAYEEDPRDSRRIEAEKAYSRKKVIEEW